MRGFTQWMGAGLLLVAGIAIGWSLQPTTTEAQKVARPEAPKPKVKADKIKPPKDPWARDDGLPAFDYQAFKVLRKYPSDQSDTSLLDTDVPGMPKGATEETFLKYNDLFTVLYYYKPNGNGPASANVKFKNVERLHFMRVDELESYCARRESEIARKTSFWAGLSTQDDGFWGKSHVGVAFLPPPDRDGRADEYAWEIKRHANGRVKTVTPYIGETEKRAHGWQCRYNDDGKLLAMTPFVNGKRHGEERIFDASSRSRLQEPTELRHWVNGQRVVKRESKAPKLPKGIKLPPKK